MRCTHSKAIVAAIIGNTFAPLLLHLAIYLYAKGVDEIQTVCIGQQYIVLGKCAWGLAAQAPEIEVG